MLLASCITPGRRYRVTISTPGGATVLELAPAVSNGPRNAGARTRHSITDRGYLPNAKWFEADDAAQLLTFWQEGKGVAIELSGYVPYTALLSLEPMD